MANLKLQAGENLSLTQDEDILTIDIAEDFVKEVEEIPKFSIKVVSELPTEDISTSTIYLVTSGEDTNNLYTEYIYVNSAWEQLGTQKLDLSDYYTKDEIDTALTENWSPKIDGYYQSLGIYAYDSTQTYNTGDYCLVDYLIYVCGSDGVTGDYDSQYWTQTTILDIIKG